MHSIYISTDIRHCNQTSTSKLESYRPAEFLTSRCSAGKYGRRLNAERFRYVGGCVLMYVQRRQKIYLRNLKKLGEDKLDCSQDHDDTLLIRDQGCICICVVEGFFFLIQFSVYGIFIFLHLIF
ncbi:hypothetical protein QE152_g37382 [Popillia japonica]|uniref:Uncharacterized protein n=1 Tax=Popillia japonica TaxID=7064 RepID=A0AAW1IAC2_POPJA